MGPRPIAPGAPVGALPSYHCVALCGMVELTIGGKERSIHGPTLTTMAMVIRR
jgi:hypothetical protein